MRRFLAGISAFLGMLGLAWLRGRSAARSERDRKDAKDYVNERKKIDAEIGSIGGTDSERVSQLQSIAKRRGASKD
jgi:hypothetical protein